MQSPDDTARMLAEAHFALDEGITRIYRVRDSKPNAIGPVILLEVNPHTVPTGIEPLGFNANPGRGVFHRSVIIEITPGEFEQLMRGELSLPFDWKLAEEYQRPPATRAAS